MFLALEDAESVRTYLAGNPAESEAVNGHLYVERTLHERKQVVHQGVSWANVITRDLGNGRFELQGWHWRTFDTYAAAMTYAVLGAELTSYEGTAVLLIPTTGSTYEVLKIADATVLPMIEKPVGKAVKVAWTVQGAYPTDEGTETIATGDLLGTDTGDTFVTDTGDELAPSAD